QTSNCSAFSKQASARASNYDRKPAAMLGASSCAWLWLSNPPFGQSGLEASGQIKQKTQPVAGFFVWCRIAGIFLTASSDNVDTYKLSNLVQQFNLSGDLIKI